MGEGSVLDRSVSRQATSRARGGPGGGHSAEHDLRAHLRHINEGLRTASSGIKSDLIKGIDNLGSLTQTLTETGRAKIEVAGGAIHQTADSLTQTIADRISEMSMESEVSHSPLPQP